MSDFGDAIISRVGNTELDKTDNPMHRILQGTIGEWLQKFNDFDYFEQFFLQEATGKYLDLHGKNFNVIRKIDESDDDYRERIIYSSLGRLTIPALEGMFNVKVYKAKTGYDLSENSLVSDNPCLNSDLILLDCSSDVEASLTKRFILEGVEFL